MCATRQRSSNEGLGIHKEARANCVAQRSAWQGFAVGANLIGALPRRREGKGESCPSCPSCPEQRRGKRESSRPPSPEKVRRASTFCPALLSPQLVRLLRPVGPRELSNLLAATAGTPAPGAPCTSLGYCEFWLL